MRSLISASLIFFVLVGQAIAAAPHVHLEGLQQDARGHAEQAHVHLHGDHGHEHAHHDDSGVRAQPASDQHDEDAVYVTDTDLTNGSHSTLLPELAASFAVLPSVHAYTVPACLNDAGCHWDLFGDAVRPQCALYAQILSIRC